MRLNIGLLLASTLVSACSTESRSAAVILSTQPNAATAAQLDRELRLFADRYGARLTATDFSSGERAYRIFGEGYEIRVVETREGDGYTAYFYSTTASRANPVLISEISDKFRAEVLSPTDWFDR